MLSKGDKQQILFITAYNTHWLTDGKRVEEDIIVEWQMGYLQSEERDFKLLCLDELIKLKDNLLSPKDATDLWRENLKAWNLKQREENSLNVIEYTYPDGSKAYSKSFKAASHYKGEF